MSNASASFLARPATRVGSLPQIWVVVAIVAVALVERAWIDTTPDVSWLLTLGEKLLAGERAYIDFIEVNPPASIYIYLPALFFARLAGFSPEFAVGLLVFAAVAASLWISARIMTEAGILRAANLWPLAAVFAAMLLVLPAATFAQREHIALISFLPMIAVSTLRANRKPVALHWAVIAGIGAGITAAIKPHFVFPVLFTAGAAAICARSWRPVFALENWISAGLMAAYAAAVIFAYPAFISDLVPIIMAVYVSQKASFGDLLTLGAIPFWCGSLLTIVAFKRSTAFTPPFVLLLAASGGFLVSFLAQQKGLAYHSYPMMALVLAGAVIAAFDRTPSVNGERLILIVSAAAIVCTIGATFSWYSATVDSRSLIGPIEASVSRPKILNISGGGLVGMGFPLTRQLGGTWVGRTCGQWMSAGAMIEKIEGADAKTSAMLDQYIERDRAALTEDIAQKKPDIILVDRVRYDWLRWAKAAPALAQELEHYRELTAKNGILVLRRQDG